MSIQSTKQIDWQNQVGNLFNHSMHLYQLWRLCRSIKYCQSVWDVLNTKSPFAQLTDKYMLLHLFFLFSERLRHLENRNEAYINFSRRSKPVQFERDSNLWPPACLSRALPLWYGPYRPSNNAPCEYIQVEFQYFRNDWDISSIIVTLQTVYCYIRIHNRTRSRPTYIRHSCQHWKRINVINRQSARC